MSALIAIVFFLAMTMAAQQTNLPDLSETERNIANAVQEAFPNTKLDLVFDFYEKHAPDLLQEWKSKCELQPDNARDYLKLMVIHFNSINKYKDVQPDEYDRLIKQQKTETKIRSLSRQIQYLAANDKANNADKQNNIKLEQLKQELKSLMIHAFDEAQERQELEINRLENQLKSLKALAQERAKNKDNILSQRFMLLTGEEWK